MEDESHHKVFGEKFGKDAAAVGAEGAAHAYLGGAVAEARVGDGAEIDGRHEDEHQVYHQIGAPRRVFGL